MFNSTLSQLVYLDSTSSTIVGGRGAVQAPALLGSFMTQYPAMDAGVTSSFTATKLSTATFHQSFNVAFAATPVLVQSIHSYTLAGQAGGLLPIAVQALDSSGFTTEWGGPVSVSTVTLSLALQAIGKVAYP
jgi:hypothetical protein